jgi:hypothetical protein
MRACCTSRGDTHHAFRQILGENDAVARLVNTLHRSLLRSASRETTADPGPWVISQLMNQREPAAAYQVPVSSFNDQPWWVGLHRWCWCSDLEPGDALSYLPRAKEAAEVLRRAWR